MGVPSVYRAASEGAIASYDFEDIASGTVYEVFYGTQMAVSGSATYHLLPNVTFSDQTSLTQSTDTAEMTAISTMDLDFDSSTFNLPRTIEGVAFVSMLLNSASADITVRAYVTIRKWDGTTETDIVSEWTRDVTNATDRLSINLTVPRTHFKKGDTLRLNITVWGRTDGTPENTTLYFDPKGADVGSEVGTLEFHVPFDPDL